VSEQETSQLPKSCLHCGGTELYVRRVSAGGSEGIYLLPGLGSFMHYAQVDVVLCARCGLTRFFAEPAARENVRSDTGWKRL
jgi:predicted nucleic-acid-binding Zn-ribbon protein